jgi:hypothetical protein
MAFIRFGRIVNRFDCPEVVTPVLRQLARARTCPKPAGMLGRIQVPSVLTGVFRFKTLTMQFWFN